MRGLLMNDQDKRFQSALELESTHEIVRRRAMHAEIVADPRAIPAMAEASAGALYVIDLVLAQRVTEMAGVA